MMLFIWVLAFGVVSYLLYALLNPEKF
ncbi:K(+)-transporting ATPase subunit F [Niallia circulans]|uniref:K(+)-transporting ATPase subunit F n=1 Tax=Niallia circulans TaxID=1397 RepID=A0A553STN0_NIACI|nr:K(+)-transporting ATPase subunit F [Niallia circulans]